ncbi:hypothetical protein HPP92_010704 [Vanilla planifolia]|uniref:Cullin family profile domain-containing protein n=1 Tax=Vanilla planifolia TaxID=51239 RepID=A0A835V1P6_VANPL|nr:hypothetical protein HPP92_010704 [Vanilla planifolia]
MKVIGLQSKVDDLSRMYRLFFRIPRGLDPVSQIFKQHVTAEGAALVKQTEDTASNKRAKWEKKYSQRNELSGIGGESGTSACIGFVVGREEGCCWFARASVYLIRMKNVAFHLLRLHFLSVFSFQVTDLTLARKPNSFCPKCLSNSSKANPDRSNCYCFTLGFYFNYKSFDLNLPAEMVKCVEVFKEFYQTKTKHRKLTWIYSLGTCNINGKFEPKTMELVVTTYQIPLPPVDEKKKVIEDVDKDRRYAIDASIVRIMKSRKVLGHQQLVMECVEQLGRMFKPDF